MPNTPKFWQAVAACMFLLAVIGWSLWIGSITAGGGRGQVAITPAPSNADKPAPRPAPTPAANQAPAANEAPPANHAPLPSNVPVRTAGEALTADATLETYALPAEGWDESQRVHLAGGISIVPPAGWTKLEAGGEYLAYFEGPLRDKTAPSIAISKDTQKHATLRAAMDAASGRLKDAGTDYQGQAAINGKTAFIILSKLSSENLKVLTVGLQGPGGAVFVFEMTARADQFDALMPAFKLAAASIKTR